MEATGQNWASHRPSLDLAPSDFGKIKKGERMNWTFHLGIEHHTHQHYHYISISF